MAKLSSNKPLLSIGILVSKRPDTIKKCVESLNHLRETVKCQLILVETGCGDEIKEYLNEVADTVDSFEWCDDFAAARNACLNLAEGQWYMYMDDDEWFESTSQIEAFFTSGEYKKYGSATYKIRNYTTEDGKNWLETDSTRLAKIHPGLKFKYRIHECFEEMLLPSKMFTDYEHHYGYIPKGPDDKQKKASRNIPLLLKEREEDPHNARHNAQLCTEYRSLLDYEKSIEISEEGIRDFDPNHKYGAINILHLNSLFGNILDCHARMNQNDEVWRKAEEFLNHEYLTRFGRAIMYSVLARASFPEEKYQECMDYADFYISMYDVKDDESSYYEGMYDVITADFMGEFTYNLVLQCALSSALWVGNIEKAREYYKRVDIDQFAMLNQGILYRSVCQDYMVKSGEISELCGEILTEMLKRDDYVIPIGIWFMNNFIEKPARYLAPRSLWKEQKDRRCEFRYIGLWEGSMSKEEKIENYQKLFEEMDLLTKSREYHFWEMIDREGEDAEEILTAIPYFRWAGQVQSAFERLPELELESIRNICEKYMNEDSDKIICIDSYVAKKHILGIKKENAEKHMDTIEKTMGDFAYKTLSRAQLMYRPELIDEKSTLLPPDIIAASYINAAFEATEAENDEVAIKQLRQALKYMPEISEAIRCFTNYLVNGEERARNKEMAALGAQVKEQICMLLDKGLVNEAYQVFNQLLALMPNDPDLEGLEKSIMARL